MKKALIIANLFHASPRIPGIAAYLPDFGWETAIITPDPGHDAKDRLGFPPQFLSTARLITAPYRGDVFWPCRKFLKFLRFKVKNTPGPQDLLQQVKERLGNKPRHDRIARGLMNLYRALVFAYPDDEIPWKNEAVKAGRAVLREERFDVILSSSPYPTNHLIARELAYRYKLPWVADFRDPWTQNHAYPYGRLRKSFEERMEHKIMANASAIIAAAPEYARKQELLLKRPVAVITNGFDSANLGGTTLIPSEKFTVTYTGAVYKGKQDPGRFFSAARKLIDRGLIDPRDLEINFYGPGQNWIRELIDRHELSNIVFLRGTITRPESLKKQKESQVLLLLNWEDPREKGVYPSKVFEYLSAGRPVIASGGFPGDGVAPILSETKAGVYASSTGDIEKTMAEYYRQYKHTGTVFYQGDRTKIDNYSYRVLAGKFACIFHSASNT